LLRLQLAAETWKDAEAFRSTSALIGAADHGSRTVAALGAGDRGRLPLGPCTHSRPLAPPWLFAADRGKSPTQGGDLKWFAGVWGLCRNEAELF